MGVGGRRSGSALTLPPISAHRETIRVPRRPRPCKHRGYGTLRRMQLRE
jgi:hypothetical protein